MKIINKQNIRNYAVMLKLFQFYSEFYSEREITSRYFWRVEETHTFADGLLIEKEYTLLRWCSVYNIERKKWDSAENYVTCMPREIQERAIMAVVSSPRGPCLRSQLRSRGHVWDRDASHGNAKCRSAFACALIWRARLPTACRISSVLIVRR